MSTLAKIQQLMQERLGLTEEQLRPEQILEEIGVDSLGLVEFMFDLEDAFGVRLTDERTAINTIRDVADLIDKALAQAQALPGSR